MSEFLIRLGWPLIRRLSTSFLYEKNISERQDALVKKKLRRLSTCSIGKKLGVTSQSSINSVPLTGYNFYLPFYTNPVEGSFIYPLTDYVKTYTSGTMGKPKIYLIPRTGLMENVKTTGPSSSFVSTFDGERFRFQVGDVAYMNIPGGTYISGFYQDTARKTQSSIVKIVPENADHMTFQQKVDYFVENHSNIDIAYMTVTTLLDQVKTRVEGPISLKAFVTSDITAEPLKERIKEFIGDYPRSIYGSTETMMCTIPSVGHPGGFFFDWRVIHAQFVPIEEAQDTYSDKVMEAPDIVEMMDVEIGKRYQLIATPYYNDITRYIMPDNFECVSKGDDLLGSNIPVFKYYSRSDKLMVLHNFTRINEQEIVSVLEEAKIPFVDFTARKERMNTKEHLVIYLELSDDMPEDEVRNRVHEAFMDFDKDYRDLSDFMGYTPLKLVFLKKGTFRKYLQNKEGMPRIARIDMREERLREVLSYSDISL